VEEPKSNYERLLKFQPTVWLTAGSSTFSVEQAQFLAPVGRMSSQAIPGCQRRNEKGSILAV